MKTWTLQGRLLNQVKIPALLTLLAFGTQAFSYQVFFEGRDQDIERKGHFQKKFKVPPFSESHMSFGQASNASLNPNSIKVFVWNMLKGERKKFERDIKHHGADRDLFILQEGYHNNNNVRVLSEIPGTHWDFATSFWWMKEGATPGGTMLGSKVEPSVFLMKRTHDLEPIIKTPKTLSIGKYPIAGMQEELLVISIHGLNFTNTQAFESHMKLAEAEMATHTGPVIFAGDFNTRNWDRYNAMVDMANRNKLHPVVFKDDKRIKPFGVYLDHSYVRGLSVKNARVLKDVKSSDHKAMTFEVAVE